MKCHCESDNWRMWQSLVLDYRASLVMTYVDCFVYSVAKAKNMKRLMLTFLPLLLVVGAYSQTNSNTLTYDSLVGSPKATLAQVSWMEGHWKGEAFGGIVEELWSPPLGGSIMFTFRLVADGKVSFYENGGIIEENGTLIFKLRHYDAQFHGWEDKDETVDFKLVKMEGNRAYFNDFTLERINADEINMYVVIGHEGKEEEIKFNYHRVK